MKYSRKQLKDIKKALREHNEEHEEQDQEEEVVSLREARRIAKAKSEEEGDVKIDKKSLKRTIRQNARKEKTVTFNWHYDVGDAVMIETGDGEPDFAIVLEKVTGTGSSQKEAIWKSGVKVLSSAGQYWVKPSKVTKIDD